MAQADLIFQGFEPGSLTDIGWSQVINNPNETWQLLTYSPYNGGYAATVLWDPASIPQDEWLISPVINPVVEIGVAS